MIILSFTSTSYLDLIKGSSIARGQTNVFSLGFRLLKSTICVVYQQTAHSRPLPRTS